MGPQAIGAPVWSGCRVQAALGCPESCAIKLTDVCHDKTAKTITTFCWGHKFGQQFEEEVSS